MDDNGKVIGDFVQSFELARAALLARTGAPDGTHARVLNAIARHGPLAPKALWALTGLDKSWITRVVQSLEAQGWVAKHANPEDARSVLVLVTEEGRAHVEQIEATLNAHCAACIEHLAPADRALARRVLVRMTSFFSDTLPPRGASRPRKS